jgi:NAD(P)-dependent dehydrogenase (short-subunit alcohol dehydrogenase family)
MARIFITGSADGLGQMAARALVEQGHKVVLHARNSKRSEQALAAVPGAEVCLTADLSSIEETKTLAKEVNKLGKVDAIIHNAGVGPWEQSRGSTVDGLPFVFAVNSLAPYILTYLIEKPRRLVYVSSVMHNSGDPTLQDLTWESKPWSGSQAYSDSKLHNILLANAVARRWHDTLSNSLEPGWVPTKMGGPGAPDSLEEAPKTQVWLATSENKQACVTGKYFYHKKLHRCLQAASDTKTQDAFLTACEKISGVPFPR